MAEEIELKLALPESAHRHVLRHPALRAALSRHTQQLINLYYDTPTRDLYRRGVALRLRRQGKTWLQTVKCAGKSAAGLTSRPEWETPYSGHFDFSVIEDAGLCRWLDKDRIRGRITPQFETNFRRTTWRFEPRRGTVVLLMFDRGWIAAGGRREAISELEIELASGGIDALYELAQALAEDIPLFPALLSKAERGYRLGQNISGSPEKAGAVDLTGDLSPAEAFRRIALACIEHLESNRAGALAGGDPEYIHQMRVATRRLRAALRLFAPFLPDEFDRQLLPMMRALMRELGQTRDMDVLFAEIAAPVMGALPEEPRLAALVGIITERHYAARQAAIQALSSPAYGRMLLLATRLLHRAGADEAAYGSLDGYASARLGRLRKKVRRLLDGARADDPSSLHALRIGIKRLRYAIEFFAPLLSKKAFGRWAERLSALQDALGQINDLANAGRLLQECAGEDGRLREAVTLIAGWHGPRHAALLRELPNQFRQLRGLGPIKMRSSRRD